MALTSIESERTENGTGTIETETGTGNGTETGNMTEIATVTEIGVEILLHVHSLHSSGGFVMFLFQCFSW